MSMKKTSGALTVLMLLEILILVKNGFDWLTFVALLLAGGAIILNIKERKS